MEGIDSMILTRTPNKGKCEKLLTLQNRGWIAKSECANLRGPKVNWKIIGVYDFPFFFDLHMNEILLQIKAYGIVQIKISVLGNLTATSKPNRLQCL